MNRDSNDTNHTCEPDCWLKLLASPTTPPTITAPIRRATNAEDSYRARLASALYTPLKPWQTRILRLEPGSTDQPLQADLLVVDIILFEGVAVHDTQALISYTALSYAWGALEYNEVLTVNNCAYPITSSLTAALRCLRDSNHHRMLWVDAVCINQHDDNERSAQVRIMLSVYRKAEQVLAWLGPSTAATSLMFDVVESLQRMPESLAALDNHGAECVKKLVVVEQGLRDVFSRPWFRRTWVRQEVFAARHLIIHYGALSVSAELLSEMRRNLDMIQGTLVTTGVYSHKPAVDELVLLTEMDPKKRKTSDLFQALIASVEFQESDPRDKVYAILGMTGTPTRECAVAEALKSDGMVVDYTRTVSEVYQDVTKYMINHHRNLTVLYLRYANVQLDAQLPSWTPDWRTVRPAESMVVEHLNLTRQKTHLYTRYQDELPPPIWQDSNETGVLRLEGHLIGIIESLSPVLFPDHQSKRLRRKLVDPDEFLNATLDIAHNTKLAMFRTKMPVPQKTQCGDCLVFLSGHSFVLRPGFDNEYRFIGATADPAIKDVYAPTTSGTYQELEQRPKELFIIK